MFSYAGNGERNEMPTVKIVVSERVTYTREVEMTEAEFREWDDKLDLRGREYDRALEDFASRYIRRDDRDFFDADDLELGEFTTVEAAA